MFTVSLRDPSLTSTGSVNVIGVVGLNPYNRLLYMFHPDFWGMGYCTEALREFQKRVFEVQPERLILIAGVHDGNEGSLKVLLKCGFVQVETSIMDSALGRRLSEEEERALMRCIAKSRGLEAGSAGLDQPDVKLKDGKELTKLVHPAENSHQRKDSSSEAAPGHPPFTWFCCEKPNAS
jgi:hypothetical protein